MNNKFFSFLCLLACIFCACDKDSIDAPEVQPSVTTPAEGEPDQSETPVVSSEFPTFDEVKRCVEGKTFICDLDEAGHTQETYVDFKGREISVDEFWKHSGIAGYVFGLAGLSFDDDNVRIARHIIYTPSFSDVGTWTYDEATGLLEAKLSMDGYEYKYRCVIESVAETQIAVRTEFGIVPLGIYELAHGMEYTGEFGRDDDSYAKATYVVVSDADAKAFWEDYPVSQ
ncbi:MAG: hypothetical protein HDS66_00465 [Bacteroidales bacterium]|nr:hypothetical protein [Bacteroidales bacterium]